MDVIKYVILLDTTGGGVSATNIITLIAAMVAAVASFGGAWMAYRSNKKALKQQRELADENMEQARKDNERLLQQQKELAEKNIQLTETNNNSTLEQQRMIADKNFEITKKHNADSLKQQREIAANNIQADVVSKARIDWIQKERDYLSDYMSLASNMQSYFAVWLADVKRDEKYKTTESFLKYCEHPVKFQNLKNILIMSLGPDDKKEEYNNEKFIELIENVYAKTEKMAEALVQETDTMALREELKELTKFARNYFKNEWNKAKDGK
ncbi:hypothetical protein DSECCO2_452420 [anaerobic digester metagenome]|uniref:hypothetical protein n=1 Tax=Acetobacterium wieringae TaxID=52694 RepID=UPI0020342F11|nr:hypothetical protein [Acetobacterium wieringae]URN84527.1 hypothetical protein CHL1_000091 [Acetobacterium wieringae]